MKIIPNHIYIREILEGGKIFKNFPSRKTRGWRGNLICSSSLGDLL